MEFCSGTFGVRCCNTCSLSCRKKPVALPTGRFGRWESRGETVAKDFRFLILFPNGFLGVCASAEVHLCMQAFQEPIKRG